MKCRVTLTLSYSFIFIVRTYCGGAYEECDVYAAPSLIELRKIFRLERNETAQIHRHTHTAAKREENENKKKQVQKWWKGKNGFCGAGMVYYFLRWLFDDCVRPHPFTLVRSCTHIYKYVCTLKQPSVVVAFRVFFLYFNLWLYVIVVVVLVSLFRLVRFKWILSPYGMMRKR